ncbi:MAG TPA: hypothetical protein VH251_11145 [Verrucomicrobiae bacterium]|jgi:hypothetical protein|nr:hypothetical protein [Verrucomicrobiae bacterium]
MNETQGALAVINELQEAGVIQKYAVGGAIAATFYIEPTATFDIDVFIPFENLPGSSLASPGKLYDYLLPRGYKTQGEHFLISGWQVQFLPADDDLYKEALLQAVPMKVGEVKTRVMRAEHLMAIALRTGRGKDLIRLEQFVHHAAFNATELDQILKRHNLVEKWRQFNDKYIRGTQ